MIHNEGLECMQMPGTQREAEFLLRRYVSYQEKMAEAVAT
jgi:hypothetical protein